MSVTREQKEAARRDFDRAMNESLVDEVKSVQSANGWTFDRAFQYVVAQNGTSFTKTPTGSRLAQAAQTVNRQSDRMKSVPMNDTSADTDFVDQGGWANAMKRLAEEARDSASPNIALIPSMHRKLISKMLDVLSTNPDFSMDQALSEVLRVNPELGDNSAEAAYNDPWYN